MDVDIKLIERVAMLARLELNDAEKKKLAKDMKEILDAFSAIDGVKSANEPMFQPIELKNLVREDKVKESLSQEDALRNTEHKKEGYFKGPRAV